MSARAYLRPDVHLKVLYDDRTPFGSAVGDRPEQRVRELFAPVYAHVEAHGLHDLLREAPRLLAEVRASPAFAAWAEPDGDAWRLRDKVLFPTRRWRVRSGCSWCARRPGAWSRCGCRTRCGRRCTR